MTTWFSDDRITCVDCKRYVRTFCSVASKRERVDVAQKYQPIVQPMRCIWFDPKDGSKSGMERWPELAADYRKVYKRKTAPERIEQMRELIS